ncbi:MAG: T9SS type A sorting domain-containing protein [Candidatus Marinimicrobia bacterium]|nr:T9SS type A sorting domain-containing protein [Candidatus Neomarinimicrobiota bacterium]
MKIITNLFIRLLLLTAVISAQWSSDPASPQLLGSGVQAQVKATSDGGVYVAWLTDMGDYHVYLQRFDATGVAQFDEGGMLVSDHNNDSWIAVFHMNLAVDSDNNAIITVLDQRSGPWNVYAYKISSDGSMVWGDNGVSVSNSSQTNYSPRFAVLPDNSVMVAWSPNATTIEIQRISSDGGLMWGDGILIEDSNESLMSPQPIVDSNGDALVQWIGQSGPVWAANSVLYLQKYDLDGISQWSEPTVSAGPVVFPMGNWSQQLVAGTGGSSFSAWTQFSGNVQNAVSQHITEEGSIAWAGGVDLSTNSSNFRMSPMLSVAEETQELMGVWKESNESQSQRGISGQRLDSSGNQLWGSNGVTVVALNSSYDYLDLFVAGFGEELISAYIQQSANMDGDIYANRLDAEGNSVWTNETVTVTNTGTAKSDMMAGKGPNCLFIAWTENGSVYAHCLREDGTLGPPDVGSSDCTADDGTGGVELWSVCYSIENTTSLNLSNTQITGEIPPEIGNLTNLTSLNLSNTQLSGEIPPEIGNLTNLSSLHIYNTQITGEIPPEIGNLTNLNTLSLGSTYIAGEIPPEIGSLTNLISLNLSNTQLAGEIPPEIGDLTNLTTLYLSNTQLIGEIPPEIGNLSNLIDLTLINNSLSGSIPASIGNLASISSLSLSDNYLSGEIPPEIGSLTNLNYLHLNNNQLIGEIPPEIGSLTNLVILSLSDNQLTGEIYETLCNLNWNYSTIENNQFCPPYPSCIEDYVGYQDTTNCEQIIDWIFSVSNPVIEVYGNNDQWNPGDTLTIELELCNNSDTAHMYYPGVILESDSNLTTILNDSYWFYGMEADTCNNVQFIVLADSTIISDTIVTFSAYPEALNCQNHPEYCIDGDTLTFDIPIILEYVSNDINNFIPKEFILHQNYPNPFNPVTTLRYDLPEDANVNISIYDMMGRVVKTLVNAEQITGYRSIQWDATNNQGQPVSAGLYLYTIEAGDFRQTKKMVLLK